MYSVVLMTALVTTTGTPTWHNRGQHHCSVPVCSCSCYGGYAGYAGYSGYAGYAGYGCHGCHGVVAPGYGAAGGCYGYHGGCYGGFGNIYADPYFGGCYGCYGGHSGYGVPLPGYGVHQPAVKVAPARDPFPPINPKKDDKGVEEVPPLKEKPKKQSDGKPNLDDSARAKVRVEIPEGGKLFVDGQHINVAAGVRTFQTPALAPGQAYYYDIRIEIEQNGAIRREERRVIINPGEDALVSFPALRPGGTSTAQVNR
jgi:uncharacterized protein (TIGR03000 family)